MLFRHIIIKLNNLISDFLSDNHHYFLCVNYFLSIENIVFICH